jgi:hypothetical protein
MSTPSSFNHFSHSHRFDLRKLIIPQALSRDIHKAFMSHDAEFGPQMAKRFFRQLYCTTGLVKYGALALLELLN